MYPGLRLTWRVVSIRSFQVKLYPLYQLQGRSGPCFKASHVLEEVTSNICGLRNVYTYEPLEAEKAVASHTQASLPMIVG